MGNDSYHVSASEYHTYLQTLDQNWIKNLSTKGYCSCKNCSAGIPRVFHSPDSPERIPRSGHGEKRCNRMHCCNRVHVCASRECCSKLITKETVKKLRQELLGYQSRQKPKLPPPPYEDPPPPSYSEK